MINDKAWRHYFMFSAGEYDDYGVTSICSCDHVVTMGEWRAHLSSYWKEHERRYWSSSREYPTWDAWYDAGCMAKFERWEKKSNPEKTFQKLHGMTVLSATNFHKD